MEKENGEREFKTKEGALIALVPEANLVEDLVPSIIISPG